jgi:hypothetical protein
MEIGSDPNPNTNSLLRVPGAQFRKEGKEGKGREGAYAYLVALRRLRGRPE